MADVTLRESLDLMRSFLRAGHLAEAFALGRHILSFYPKHIETYTVLAQVSLATNDLAGANDLLRRVLSSDPENVIALAGMALISEAQDKQDEALWYLERAYEIQPSNDELRGELLRVREQYYGTTPARMELTPGALARVYARQGQYAQAINEYRRLLRSESERYDAQVGLAETLYRSGRTDEAAQIAQSVMRDAPYALKPNLILGALWTENAVPEGQQFLQRAHQLDPEHRVARDLLGERFDGADAPRLPEMGEPLVAAPVLPSKVPEPAADEYPLERDTARAALVWSEIERAQELETTSQEPLVADLQALEPFDLGQPESESHIPGTAAKLAVGALAADLTAEALKPEPETDAQPEPQVSPPPAAAARPAHKSEGISPEAIAAAAAALATSIALDKSNQPAPTLRTHPAIPKVRPVIPGNTEKLPSWLYLSATPANANASFDALSPPTDREATPASMQPDRPDWLVQAEAAITNESARVTRDDELPDWLKPAAVVGATAAVVSETAKSSDASKSESKIVDDPSPALVALPDWLQDTNPASDAHAEESQSNAAIPLAAVTAVVLNADRSDDELQTLSSAQSSEVVFDTPTTQATSGQALGTATAVESAVTEERSVAEKPLVDAAVALPVSGEPPEFETAPPVMAGTVLVEEPSAAETAAPEPAAVERSQTQAVPDSATMLQMARDKRDSGDIKGALELYERVMHRRPNHLDQVTADLEAIVGAGDAPLSANRLLGEAYAMVGRFKESLVQYRTALGKPPGGS